MCRPCRGSSADSPQSFSALAHHRADGCSSDELIQLKYDHTLSIALLRVGSERVLMQCEAERTAPQIRPPREPTRCTRLSHNGSRPCAGLSRTAKEDQTHSFSLSERVELALLLISCAK